MRRIFTVLAVVAVLGLSSIVSQAQPAPAGGQEGRRGYYRFPTLHANTLVFAAEGDLWRVDANGGVAQRLTTHPAEETSPTISPDGRTVAFTARYEGPAELYTMPLAGGLPKRWTYESDTSLATTWHPDGGLIYTTTQYSTLPELQLVKLDLQSGHRGPIPLAQASEGSLDASGRTIYFVRPAFHRNVTKRYQGGTARKIWRFSAGDTEATVLTPDYDGESHSPLWHDGRVYFVTDRDGTMNLWSMDETGGDPRQHTFHSGWDVREPAIDARGAGQGSSRVVYQVGADLWMYDIAADTARELPITLASDFDQLREKWVDEPMDYLTSAHLHPNGESLVLTARGRVFVAPAKRGRLVRASRAEGVRYRDVVFMPDGERLLALSDETDELELITLPADGVGEADALTSDGGILRFQGNPSPNGTHIAYIDNNNDLWLLDLTDDSIPNNQQVISQSREGVFGTAWSPDGSWLAYSEAALNTYTQIWLYEVATGRRVELTSDRVNSFNTAWSPDGEWLYFLSDRNLQTIVGSPWGARQPEPYFDRTMKIFQVSLQSGARSPFLADDEISRRADDDGDDGDVGSGGSGDMRARGVSSAMRQAGGGGGRSTDAGQDDSESDDLQVTIDVDGIQRRVREVPAPAGNYGGLAVNGDALFFTSRVIGAPRPVTALMALAINSDGDEPARVAANIRSFELSVDGKSMLVRQGNDLYVAPAAARPTELGEHKVDLSGWTFPINVAEDWRQIFMDAWRLERDYFYDPGMHEQAWDVVLEKYMQLVGRITTREELSDLIGRVVGELSALHTSVRGGDLREGDDSITVASLGARLLRDPDNGGYRIDYIYQGDPDYPNELSPLAHPDLAHLNIRAGDTIERVNGVDVLSVGHIGVLLRNQQGKQVLLTIRSQDSEGSDGANSHDAIVYPIANESGLRYTDWEVTRRTETEMLGEGKLGYVHLRAMGGGDLNAWYRQFYPVHDRQGLILDMRRNRGGNIDSIILEKLMRQA